MMWQGEKMAIHPTKFASSASETLLPTEKGDGSARAAGREAAGPRGARARRGPGGGWSRWARAVG
jgi:hypothetical protein